MDSTTSKLVIAFLSLLIVALLVGSAFYYMRYKKRRAQCETLPLYVDIRPQSAMSQHRPLASRSNSDFLEQEKKDFYLTTDSPPPSSPIPEIRITLPDDTDSSGKSQTGRTVLVHVGDKSVGFEPYTEKREHYQDSEADKFQSLDLQRIGGLKEKTCL